MTYPTLTDILLISSCIFISVLCHAPAPIIKSLHIKSDIKYTYAKTLVTSRVLNPANVSQEVTFRVTLPEEAFITGFVMIIEGKPYEAYIKEKEEAKKDYDTAVSAGQSAGHISQTNTRFSKDFTVSVNVEPEKKVSFNLTYEELLSRKNRTYKNEINIHPNQIVSSLSIVVDIEDILNITNIVVPQFRMTNEIDHHETDNRNIKKKIISPNKIRIEWNPSIDEQKELNAEGLNGQMVVKYDVDTSNNPQQILVDQDGYFVHILRNDDLPVLNKHVVFVLDVSGSMHGLKIEQLKQAMAKILSDLSEQDYFSIVLFSVKILPWKIDGVDSDILNGYYEEPLLVPVEDNHIISANKKNVALALEFVKSLSDFGGTNINGGLRVGIDIAKLGQKINQNSASPVESMIIFLTDGEPNSEESDPDKIIENVDKRNTGKVTIFSLGFGLDADMKFLKKLSISNNGFARRIYEDSDAASQLNNFYKEVASPVLSDIKFEYLPDQVENTTAETKNLFSGSEVLILGKVKPNSTVSGVLLATTPEGRKKIPIPTDKIDLIEKESNHTFGNLEKMWAYKTIKYLLDQNTVSKNESTEKKAKELALKYKFVTPLTSLVVVKPNVSAVVDDKIEDKRPVYGSYAPRNIAFKTLLPIHRTKAYSNNLILHKGMPGSAGAFFSSSVLSLQSARLPSLTYNALPAPQFSHHLQVALPEADEVDSTMFHTTEKEEGTTEVQYKARTEAQYNTTTYTKVPYTSVSWLNQTVSNDGLFLQPPSEVDKNDMIALNETDISTTKCFDGSDCRHFIFCTLEVFAHDVQEFSRFKCHIDPKFLGVCCPTKTS